MNLLLVAYLGGVLTVVSPCILPVLPFVFARSDRPFTSHALPLLCGMALAFAAVASLAAVGGWAVALNQGGRYAAMALLALFGLALLSPVLAERAARPLVALGARLSQPGVGRLSPLLLGVATGLLWAPCAGPILGLILTAAALNGASLGTSLLLLAYAAGAGASLAIALLAGRRVHSLLQASARAGEALRRAAGVAVLASVAAISLGLDVQVLGRLSAGITARVEQALLDRLMPQPPADEPGEAGGTGGKDAILLAAGTEASLPASTPRSQGPVASLAGVGEWINSPALDPASLHGKVVLVDFWTYSCINCLRTLPYLRAWADKYGSAGLVVIGVHTPEFAFEKRPDNVRRATRDLGIGFPVAIDNDYAVWRAFGNRYWPAFYFIDASGRIRHRQFGEGGYDTAERMIQQLLREAGQALVPGGLVDADGRGAQAAAGQGPVFSGESYLGHARAEGFASPGGLAPDRLRRYPPAPPLRTNQWALTGDWRVDAERAVLHRAHGRISHRFHARDLHLVLGIAPGGKPVRFRVLLDGQPPLGDRGADVDEQGLGTIDGQRLYQLVRQTGARERLFEIEFLDEGAQAYAFTFG